MPSNFNNARSVYRCLGCGYERSALTGLHVACPVCGSFDREWNVVGWEIGNEAWPLEEDCFVAGFQDESELIADWLRRAKNRDIDGFRHEGSIVGYFIIYGSAIRRALCAKHFGAWSSDSRFVRCTIPFNPEILVYNSSPKG